jgi:GNAT superfamily N-acetyltransferase
MDLHPVELTWNGYSISTDPTRLDLRLVHAYLANESYWAAGIPLQIFLKSIENSLCFGVYHQDQQVGFARVISDYATFAYLGDVFILEGHRHQGCGKWLMECIVGHPQLQGLRRWMLATQDAHGLYAQFGFKPLENPDSLMEIVDLEVYNRKLSPDVS